MGTSTSSDQATTSVRIERSTLDRLKEIAAQNRRSVSQEIRWLIDQHIAAVELEEASS